MEGSRGPNIQCRGCGGVTKFVRGATRCIDKQCSFYWEDQGGIESLTPNPPQPPAQGENMPIRITKPT